MALAKETGISKIAAVKKALKELGKEAMPGKIQEYVKEKFGLEMTTSHVSNCKTHLRKKKSKKATAARQTENIVAPAAAPANAPSAQASGLSASLTDIAAVKNLVERVGEENLKSLIGVLGG